MPPGKGEASPPPTFSRRLGIFPACGVLFVCLNFGAVGELNLVTKCRYRGVVSQGGALFLFTFFCGQIKSSQVPEEPWEEYKALRKERLWLP